MGITDSILAIQEEQKKQQTPWIQELIANRQQPQQQKKQYTPVGFQFQREPFDPSSYYRALGTFRDVSRLATEATKNQIAYQLNQQREAEYAANQDALQRALGGVGANFNTIGSSVGNLAGGISRKYGLKSITSNTSSAADYWGSKYGIKTIGGYREHGSVPGSDHPKGRALDFMINNMKNGTNVGTALANDVIKNYKAWNVKYVIWNRYIWTPNQGWHRYNGPSPHTDHVHVSFNK